MTKRKLGTAAVAAMLVAGLSACGANSSSSSGGAGSSGAASGGTLRIALGKPADNLDPQQYIGVWGVQSVIFEPLVNYGPNGKIEPGLAQSWTVSNGGKTYTFHLHPNVKFTDGTPCDARAVKWNFDRWIKVPDNVWLGVSKEFASDRAVDATTFQLNLKHPYVQALQELTYIRPVRMLSPASVTAKGAYKDPIGTGPFKLVSSNDQETVLVRNDAYWGPKPKIDKLDLKVITDSQSRLSALRAGDVDVIGGDYTAPMTPRDALTLQGASNVQVVDEPGSGTLILGFNEDKGPLRDIAVRRAVSLAVDRQAISKALYLGQAQPADSLFPPTVPFSGPHAAPPAPDPAQAKQLLDAAGWKLTGTTRSKNGTPLQLTLIASDEAMPGVRALSEVIQQELKGIGVDVQIKLLDHASKHDEIPKRRYDMTFFLTLGAPYDPFSTLTDLFDTRNDSGTDGKIFTDLHLNTLIDRALAADTPAQQTTAYDTLYGYLRDQAAFLPLVYTPRIWAHSTQVHGMTLPPTEYELPWAGISLGK